MQRDLKNGILPPSACFSKTGNSRKSAFSLRRNKWTWRFKLHLYCLCLASCRKDVAIIFWFFFITLSEFEPVYTALEANALTALPIVMMQTFKYSFSLNRFDDKWYIYRLPKFLDKKNDAKELLNRLASLRYFNCLI